MYHFIVYYVSVLCSIVDDRLIIENKPGICEFTIQNTLPTDRGSYNVVVTNKLGNDSAIVKLVVEGKHIINTQRKHGIWAELEHLENMKGK